MIELLTFKFRTDSVRIVIDNEGRRWINQSDYIKALGYTEGGNFVSENVPRNKQILAGSLSLKWESGIQKTAIFFKLSYLRSLTESLNATGITLIRKEIVNDFRTWYENFIKPQLPVPPAPYVANNTPIGTIPDHVRRFYFEKNPLHIVSHNDKDWLLWRDFTRSLGYTNRVSPSLLPTGEPIDDSFILPMSEILKTKTMPKWLRASRMLLIDIKAIPDILSRIDKADLRDDRNETVKRFGSWLRLELPYLYIASAPSDDTDDKPTNFTEDELKLKHFTGWNNQPSDDTDKKSVMDILAEFEDKLSFLQESYSRLADKVNRFDFDVRSHEKLSEKVDIINSKLAAESKVCTATGNEDRRQFNRQILGLTKSMDKLAATNQKISRLDGKLEEKVAILENRLVGDNTVVESHSEAIHKLAQKITVLENPKQPEQTTGSIADSYTVHADFQF